MKRRLTSEGLTLVEVLVTIAVAGVVVIALNSIVTNYLHISGRGRFLNLANSYVEGKVESLRNLGFNSLSSGTTNLTSELPAQLPRQRSASMTVSNASAALKQVDITVSYFDEGKNNSYSYTTYIGEIGVGQ